MKSIYCKNNFLPYKKQETKKIGENCFGENLGSGENKERQTKLYKKKKKKDDPHE